MGKKTRKPEQFIRKPSYPGGKKALDAFIVEHMEYPEEALENAIEGTVKLKFDIDNRGKVRKPKVISGIGHGCDEEAMRLVKLLKWKVENHHGVKITFHKNLNIHFRIPPDKKAKSKAPEEAKKGLQLNYTITPKDKSKDDNKTGGSYTYTLS